MSPVHLPGIAHLLMSAKTTPSFPPAVVRFLRSAQFSPAHPPVMVLFMMSAQFVYSFGDTNCLANFQGSFQVHY